MKDKKRVSAKEWIRRGLLLICIAVFCFSAYNLVQIFLDYKEIDDSYGEIANTYVEEPEEENHYLVIDWASLQERNSDVVAWIQIPDTNVNYPVLQGETNDTYIHSDIDKNNFKAGSIFVDATNQNPFVDNNTVIYGHNMKNGSMFHNIKSYTNQEFANEHPYVYIYLPDGTVSQYQVFAGHIISETSVLYNTYISDLTSFYQEIMQTNNIHVDIDETNLQPIVTLSTCTSAGSDSGKRNVVHAMLKRTGIDPTQEIME